MPQEAAPVKVPSLTPTQKPTLARPAPLNLAAFSVQLQPHQPAPIAPRATPRPAAVASVPQLRAEVLAVGPADEPNRALIYLTDHDRVEQVRVGDVIEQFTVAAIRVDGVTLESNLGKQQLDFETALLRSDGVPADLSADQKTRSR
ncbi:MAG: hypothetical protein AAGB51_15145 [Planctomycetota bacterium]